MRVLTWNTNFRRDAEGQVAAVLAQRPHVAVLQEVRAAGIAELQARFRAAGMRHFASSHDATRERVLGRYVVVASRYPFVAAEGIAAPLAPAVLAHEATVAVEVRAPGGRFDLLGVYVPTVARADGVKVPTQLAIHARMRSALERPHILCGDFNSPKAEALDGTVTLFTRPIRAAEYAGEHALMEGLREFGLQDAFRARNGYRVDERSWFWKNRGRTGGYRLDHIFVSGHFRVARCWYDHSVRERGLSDHSIMCANVLWRREALGVG